MKPRHRPDANRSEIVGVLRDAGAMVVDIESPQEGAPDLAVIWLGSTTWLELKSESGQLSEAQKAWHEEAAKRGVCVEVARTPYQALKAVGITGAKAEDRLKAMREIADSRHPGQRAARAIQPSVRRFP